MNFTAISVDVPRYDVVHIRLNRPQKRNALSLTLCDELAQAAELCRSTWLPKAVVLSGEGPAFCGGFDVTALERADSTAAQYAMAERVGAGFAALSTIPAIRIAAIQGACVGAGILLSSQCHMRYSADDAFLFVPELDLGIPFSYSGVGVLSELVGVARAAEMTVEAQRMPADHVPEFFSQTQCGDAEAVVQHALAVADRIASRPTLLVKQTYGELEAAMPQTAMSRNDYAAFVASMADPECREVQESYIAQFG